MSIIYVCTKGRGKHKSKEEELIELEEGGFECPIDNCGGKLFTLSDSEGSTPYTLRLQLFRGEPTANSEPEEEIMLENNQPLDRPDSITPETWPDYLAAIEAVKARLEK